MAVNLVRWTSALAVIGVFIAMLPSMLRNNFFSFHPCCMAIAYTGLMAEGVLLAVMFRSTDGKERVASIQYHAFVQISSVVAMALGFYVIYRNKMMNGKAHFTSLHGKAGVVTALMTAAAALGGVMSFRQYGIIQRFPTKLQPTLKAMHRTGATVAWYCGLVTMQLALPHPAVLTGVVCWLWQATVFMLGFSMFVLLMRPRGRVALGYYGESHKLL